MRVLIVAACCIIVSGTPAPAQIDNRREPPKSNIEDPNCNRKVKGRTNFGEGSQSHSGEVIKIDEKEMHVMVVPPLMWTYRRENGIEVKHFLPREKPQVRVFRPIDVLANGKVLDRTFGAAYRWQDIQKGDTIKVDIVNDVDEKIDYVVNIRLDLRPGGKIPEPQNPKEGEFHYLRANVRNDIENGLAVSEEEVQKAFPYKPNPFAPLPVGTIPPTDVLPADYRKKLDDIRAKKAKDKELKAKPATDKSDPKKEDKK